MTYVVPPIDEELGPALRAMNETFPSTISADMVPGLRELTLNPGFPDTQVGTDVVHEEHVIAGYDGAEIVVSVFRPSTRTVAGPALFHLHGGGMVLGDRFSGLQMFMPYISSHGAVVVTVEYRLAPEFPDPIPVEDCYAALVWTWTNAEKIGLDPDRILVVGGSAGGGLAAGVALLARDRHGPPIRASLLMYPMIDDRNDTVSSHQFQGVGMWDRYSNMMGWDALLGERRGTDGVSIYAAPSRADDLSGLPPTFIDVGSAEVFRDEAVAYASKIWADGGVAELHVWPGAFHGCDVAAPQAHVSQGMAATRDHWLRRVLDR